MSVSSRESVAPPMRRGRGLPEEIFVSNILVRLPPKTLLRCRAVCSAWRHATSTPEFLLAHHALQPALPLLCGYNDGEDDESLDVIPFDHRAGLVADARIRSVARLGRTQFFVEASCDGLLVVSIRNEHFGICNPATRQYAPLWLLSGFKLLGMYPHTPTGQYRLLMYQRPDPASSNQPGCYVFALGSGQPPRHIGWPEVVEVMPCTAVLFRGCLHWHRRGHGSENSTIVVFDTMDESFQQMRAPLPGRASLFEMDGVLGMFRCNAAATVIDIWVLQNYESEEWTFKCRIELPVTEIRARCGNQNDRCDMVVVPGDGELLVLVKFAEWLVQVDMDGKLVSTFHRKEVRPTQLQLRQTLVQHGFFPRQSGYVVNRLPFI